MAGAPVNKGWAPVNKGCFFTCTTAQEIFGGNNPVSNHKVMTACVCYNSVSTLMKPNHVRSISANASEREKPSRFTLGSSSREKQLRSLDSYFKKFKNDIDTHNISNRSGEERGPGPVSEYFGKVFDKHDQFKVEREPPVKNGQGTEEKVDDQGVSNSDCDEASGLYIIGMLASMNIAVYLFEIASPVNNSDLELFSLPALYGAKINHLILYGEWWRLFTPMFLHTGILHIGFGCWILLTFGPQVCKVYGPFTFFLIYILGGLSGNLTSFLHTPDPTVGGTGPVFAVIGAWLIYQYQNKDAIGKDVFDSMYQKAVVATALGFVLSTFGPIDDWTHFGSVFTGIAYGFVTCPSLQIDESSSTSAQESGKDNRIRLIGRNVDPRKSLLFFSIFVVVLSSLLVIFEPPLGSLAVDTLV